MTDNLPVRIYINKIENKVAFKIKTGYYLKLLMPETIKLLGSTKNEITKDENDENIPHLEITEVVLLYCNFVDSDCQQYSRILHTFIPNKSFGQLLNNSPKNFILKNTFNSQFPCVEVWFTDYIPKLLEIEDKISITLVID